MTAWKRGHGRTDHRATAPRCYCPHCGAPTGRGWRPRICTRCKNTPLGETFTETRRRLKGSGH